MLKNTKPYFMIIILCLLAVTGTIFTGCTGATDPPSNLFATAPASPPSNSEGDPEPTGLFLFSYNGYNLGPGADLRGADLHAAHLQNIDLSGADLTGANMQYTDLSGANLSNAIFNNAKMDWSILDKANVDGARFENTNLQFAHMKEMSMDWTIFNGADLSNVYMRYSDMLNCSFSGCILQDVNFKNIHSINTGYSSSDLTGASFNKAWLEGANFRAATGLDLTGATCVNVCMPDNTTRTDPGY